jgi:hypothetical protein
VIAAFSGRAPESLDAQLLLVPFSGTTSAVGHRIDALLGGSLVRLAETAKADAGAVGVVQAEPDGPVAARRVALVGVGSGDGDDLRAAAAAGIRAAGAAGGTVVWAFDAELGAGQQRLQSVRRAGDHQPLDGRRPRGRLPACGVVAAE